MKNKGLPQVIEKLQGEAHMIDPKRVKLLLLISDLIKEQILAQGKIDIIAICTHNSRRSQLVEAWIVAACQYFEITNVFAFSGGTEGTAFNIRMVVALRKAFFHLHTDGPRNNPFYTLETIERQPKPHIMYSKVYDHPTNPREGFMALMVCDHADENCPIVDGAKHRIGLHYKDPKEYDDTPFEQDMYDEKVLEIGREMIFLINEISK